MDILRITQETRSWIHPFLTQAPLDRPTQLQEPSPTCRRHHYHCRCRAVCARGHERRFQGRRTNEMVKVREHPGRLHFVLLPALFFRPRVGPRLICLVSIFCHPGGEKLYGIVKCCLPGRLISIQDIERHIPTD